MGVEINFNVLVVLGLVSIAYVYYNCKVCSDLFLFFVLFSRLSIRLTSVNLLLVPVLHHTSKLKLY
jgi:hypothetical protein